MLLCLLWCDSLSNKYDVSVLLMDKMLFKMGIHFHLRRCCRHNNGLEQFVHDIRIHWSQTMHHALLLIHSHASFFTFHNQVHNTALYIKTNFSSHKFGKKLNHRQKCRENKTGNNMPTLSLSESNTHTHTHKINHK